MRSAVLLGPELASCGPAADVALGPLLLRGGLAGADEILRIHVPSRTAAFSRRDTRQAGFVAAAAAVRELGFMPVVRSPGGSLAVYHGGSIVIDHIGRCRDAQADNTRRFERFSRIHASLLVDLGVDARVGQLPEEYCPGEFSVNVGGTHKVVGSAQRVTRDGWLFSTVIQVGGAAEIARVTAAAYEALGYDLDVGTVGALEDFLPGVSVDVVARAVRSRYEADLGALPTMSLPDDMRRQLAAAAASNEYAPR